jgi:hypothetical protein
MYYNFRQPRQLANTGWPLPAHLIIIFINTRIFDSLGAE